jgi:hypothetical protein
VDTADSPPASVSRARGIRHGGSELRAPLPSAAIRSFESWTATCSDCRPPHGRLPGRRPRGRSAPTSLSTGSRKPLAATHHDNPLRAVTLIHPLPLPVTLWPMGSVTPCAPAPSGPPRPCAPRGRSNELIPVSILLVDSSPGHPRAHARSDRKGARCPAPCLLTPGTPR